MNNASKMYSLDPGTDPVLNAIENIRTRRMVDRLIDLHALDMAKPKSTPRKRTVKVVVKRKVAKAKSATKRKR